MRNYSFGNFICALRRGRGLSQFQLGALVGVSDKAVSKWENGAARPRLDTCSRLAEVLGVNVDELLSCQYQEGSPERKDVVLMYEYLWEKAWQRLWEQYGPQPPLLCWSRLETEQAVLKRTDAVASWDFLALLAKEAAERSASAMVRGVIHSSFAAWLLGASEVNPLPTHYHCPVCHDVEFHKEARCGFDLPEKTCACGAAYLRDGHDIPFEGYAGALSRGNCLEVDMDQSFLPRAVELLESYYRPQWKILPVRMGEYDHERLRFYVLLPMEEPIPVLNEEGVLPMSAEDFHTRYRGYTYYLFHAAEQDASEKHLGRSGRKPTISELLSPSVLEEAFRERERRLPGITNAIGANEPINFSLLLQIDGLAHGTDVWEDNGEVLLRNGTASFRELMAFREDVWQAVLSRVTPGTISGTGLPLRIMEDVRLGRYFRHGMPKEIRDLFERLGMPAWYADHVGKIGYLFPKGHSTAWLLEELKRIWYRLREELKPVSGGDEEP